MERKRSSVSRSRRSASFRSGDVLHRADHPHRLAGGVAEHLADRVQDGVGPVLPEEPVVHLEVPVLLERRVDRPQELVLAGRMHLLQHEPVVRCDLARLVAVDPVQFIGPVDRVSNTFFFFLLLLLRSVTYCLIFSLSFVGFLIVFFFYNKISVIYRNYMLAFITFHITERNTSTSHFSHLK